MKLAKLEKEDVLDFAEHSTTHGISYAFERDVRPVSRLSWLVTCVGLFALATYLIAVQYHDWQARPVLTTIGTTGHPVTQVEFPTVTICSQGIADDIIEGALA